MKCLVFFIHLVDASADSDSEIPGNDLFNEEPEVEVETPTPLDDTEDVPKEDDLPTDPTGPLADETADAAEEEPESPMENQDHGYRRRLQQNFFMNERQMQVGDKDECSCRMDASETYAVCHVVPMKAQHVWNNCPGNRRFF